MIDPNSESLISLGEAARLLPARRGGKKPHISCLYRWTTTGCKGVVLESLQVGGTRCTSKEALSRFFQRLTAASQVSKAEEHSSSDNLRAEARTSPSPPVPPRLQSQTQPPTGWPWCASASRRSAFKRSSG